MKERDRQERLAVASAGDAYRAGRMSRRAFWQLCARAGLAVSGISLWRGCKSESSPPPAKSSAAATAGELSASTTGSDTQRFLKEMGRRFTGTKLQVVCEDTPVSGVINTLISQEFTPQTGIEVEWERLPLERVLAKVSSVTARQSGSADILYLDQAWIGRFANDTADPRALLDKADLAYPGYDFADILPTLVENIASYQGRLAGIPFDLPIFIMMYRKDIFDELKLKVPTTLAEYHDVIKAISEAKAPQVYGTTGQWKSGHYSLTLEMVSWMWAHGGSVFGPEQRAAVADERAEAAMQYALTLGKYMPPGVTTWDWFGQAHAFEMGQAGMFLGAAEWFPRFDDPALSKIVGLAEAAPCPKELELRRKDQCSFDETPGLSRQGGSSLAISKYSKNIDAAWVLLQWATSADVTTRASILGGGASPIRKSNYEDPRIRENARVMPGTTRHFPVTLDAVMNRMGTEPHLPAWVSLADAFAVELGKMTTNQQDIRTTLENMAIAANGAVPSSEGP